MGDGAELPWTAALTTSAEQEIRAALAIAERPEDFLGHVDVILRRPGSLHRLAEEREAPDSLDVTSRQGGIDVENAVSVHRYLGTIDRANAASLPFWNYTAFVTYRSYMEERWPLEGLKDTESWKNRVKDRWMLASPTRGKLIRHGVARLWWVADLTVDPDLCYPLSKDDPYGYTREVFRNEDRIINIFDREVGAIPPLMRAVLERAANGGESARDRDFRDLMRAMTLVHGYRDVGVLDGDSLADLLASLAPTYLDASGGHS